MIFLQLEAGGDDITVQRIFDDFEWLQHSLTTENDIGGIIVSKCEEDDITNKALFLSCDGYQDIRCQLILVPMRGEGGTYT